MNKFKWFLLLMFLTSSVLMAKESAATLGAKEFLKHVRNPSSERSYAKLSGVIQHLRRDQEQRNAPIYFGVMLSDSRRLSQIIVDNSEGYRLGQSYTEEGEGTTVTPMNPAGYPNSILADFGVKPEDLSMSFIYDDFINEFAPTTLRTANCRVFMLQNRVSGERELVYITTDYLFPIKVEFFAKDNSDLSKPDRTMEVERFKKSESGFWVPTQLKLYGAGWRTIVKFDDIEAEQLDPSSPPMDIFRTIK